MSVLLFLPLVIETLKETLRRRLPPSLRSYAARPFALFRRSHFTDAQGKVAATAWEDGVIPGG
eukprot:CAMPEP_0197452580 /NCGR_PEP_ID=MMETSP1175-20131217/32440_1 /TAXON_ID=1003142 /ORGANISM="Triceratium dubium, Strain CCMP147" /LENGTH=62 /DNA_ID=CAMNT_0042985635 /DNA_START=124 /DNA_END=313 /DNA_ORIENTATION=+